MADNFGLKIGLEGEKEFKKALADINQSFKVLGSEMKLVTSQFDKNDSSADALAAKRLTTAIFMTWSIATSAAITRRVIA